jgi:hypothetical protein
MPFVIRGGLKAAVHGGFAQPGTAPPERATGDGQPRARQSLAASSLFVLPRFAIGEEGPPPSRRLNLAFIGAGGQAEAAFSGCDGENFVALCDVDDKRARRRPTRSTPTRNASRISG